MVKDEAMLQANCLYNGNDHMGKLAEQKNILEYISQDFYIANGDKSITICDT